MKVKNFGSTPISIVVAGVRYQFAADAVLEFEDKNELLVDEAIKIYPDLKVIYENKEEEILTDDEIAQAIADHNSSPSAHSGAILGAISDHVAELDPHTQYQKESEKDAPNGYAGLDSGGKVNISVLPSSIMRFKDFWNAATNTPTLADGIGTAGDVYEVPAGGAGTQDLGSGSQTFAEGDWIVYNGLGQWKKSLNSAAAIPDASEVVAGKVNISAQTFGGHKTFAGGLSTPVAPTSANHVANKAFVDSKVNTNIKLITSGLWSWSVSSSSSVVDSDEVGAGNGNPFYKYTAIPFTLAQQTTLTQIELRLRQFSGAASLTVDVVPDVAGSPDETNILATSGLGNVTSSSFEWVPFSLPNTVLAAGTYWMVFTIPNGVAIEFSNANQAKISTDLGATWVLEPNNNVLFRVTGSTETSSLNLSQDAFIQVAGLPDASNKISPFTDSLANGEVLWVTLNKTNTPQTLTVNKSLITAVQNDPDKFILVRRIGTKVFVSDDFFVQAASVTEQGLVNISAQTFGGHKTFKDGLTSQEEIIISSTLNSYASIRTANTVGISQEVVIASGDSSSNNSGDIIVASGNSTPTAPSPLTMQGVTWTYIAAGGVGRIYNETSIQIIVDDTNITNPAAPNFSFRGSAGQRLVIRVNSATTVDQLVAAFLSAGAQFTNTYSISGSGTSTFVNDTQFLTGAKGHGRAILASDYQAVVESGYLVLGLNSGQANITTPTVTGANSSDTIFLISGRVQGTGSSGSISIRSADMEGSGGSGAVFFRTGSVNGSIGSGSTNISTGATTTYSTANSGGVNINSGSINGISGNSGNVLVSSGSFATATQTGTTGQVQIFTGNYAGNGSVSGGLLFVGGGGFTGAGSGTTSALSMRSGDKTNALATGNTGTLTVRSGNHAGTGNTGTAFFASGNANIGDTGFSTFRSGNVTGTGGNSGGTIYGSGDLSGANIGGVSGTVTLRSGNVSNASATGATGSVAIVSGDNSGSNNTGYVEVRSGNILGTGSSGSVAVNSGFVSGNGNSGTAVFGSGSVNGTGFSGYTLYGSGNATNGGSSGQSDVRTGNASVSSGQIIIATGNAGTGNSGNLSLSTGTAGGTRGVIDMNARGVQVSTNEYVSLNSQGNIILNHGTLNNSEILVIGGSTLGNGNIGLALSTRDGISYGNAYNSLIRMANYNDKVNLAIEAGYDSATALAGNLILAAGFAGQGTNNGGHLYLESGGSIGGNGGDIQLKINGIGTTVGKIKLDGVLKAFVRTGHTNLEDGDIWFDGTDLKMRIGGVTKTFTLV